jgi:hypothetical protein
MLWHGGDGHARSRRSRLQDRLAVGRMGIPADRGRRSGRLQTGARGLAGPRSAPERD